MNEKLVYFDKYNQFYKIIFLQFHLNEKILDFWVHQIQLIDKDHHLKKHLVIYFINLKKKDNNQTLYLRRSTKLKRIRILLSNILNDN